MECLTEPATYTLQLNDPIDAICSDSDFNKVAIIQRCKNPRSASVITLLEVCNEKLIHLTSMSFPLGKFKQSPPSSIAWSPIDDHMIASSTPLGNILVWDIVQEQTRENLEGTKAYTAIKFHNFDRNLIATGSTDSSLMLYDMRFSKHKPSTVFSGNHMCVRDIDLGKHTDNYHQLVAVGDGGNIKFWDIRNALKHVKEIPAHNGQIMSVTLNQTHKNMLATSGRDKFIRIWDTTKNDGSLYSIETPSSVEKVVWTNENSWNVCSFSSPMTNREISDCGLYLWDFRRPYMPYKHFQRHEDVVTDVIFPDDATREIFISCDASGKVLLHKSSEAKIPMQQAEYISVACSSTHNECVISTPMYARDFDPSTISTPDEFARRVKSRVTVADTSERLTDSEKFSYLAKRYKLFSPNGESLIDLCKYNSQIANSVGDSELSSSWQLLGVLAGNDEISSIRPMLGQQIRPPTELPMPNIVHNDTETAVEEKGDGNQPEIPKEESLKMIEPTREFCYDQELFDFSGVLEEEKCKIAGCEEILSNDLCRPRKKRFVPRMRLIERNDYYIEEIGEDDNEITGSFGKRKKVRKVHKYYGGARQKLSGVRFHNTRDGHIKRTCINFVFDNSKPLKKELIGKSVGPLARIRSTYDERMTARKREVEEAERRQRQRSLTKKEKEILHKKRMEKRTKEENMRWIDENKILQVSRAPITEMHREIIQRTKIYHAKQTNSNSKETEQKKKPKSGRYKPTKRKNNWDQIQTLFDYYMALDDVQMVACMALCVGEKITMLIPEASVDRWFHFYTDLLEQFCLFKEATFFMKASYRIQLTRRNGDDNFVKNICVECGNTLTLSPICEKCAYEHFCVICENLVYGSWMLCIECGHGGHPEHIREWFSQHDNCPAAFCDHSCFPSKRKNEGYVKRQKTRSGSPTVTYHLRARHGAWLEDSEFWKHKIPPS